MNSKGYRWCAVPQCTNTSIKTPNKLFVFVPQNKTIRDKWLKLARRDSSTILPKTHLYFCEDHFDMPNDMQNYMEYHLMGSVSQIRMKPGCLPTKYQCQSVIKIRKSYAPERSYLHKKRRKTLIGECEKDLEEATVPTKPLGDTSGSSVPAAPARELHKDIHCNECGGDVVGFRYTCVQCADFDLCAACEAGGAHAAHYVLRVPRPTAHMEIAKILWKIGNELQNNDELTEPETEATDSNEGSVKIEIKEEIVPESDPLQGTVVDIKIEPLEYPEERVVQSSSSTSNILQTALPDAETKTSSAAKEPVKTTKKRPAPQKTIKAEPRMAKESPANPNRKLEEVRCFSGPGSSVSTPMVVLPSAPAQGTRSPDSGGGFISEVSHRTKKKPRESAKKRRATSDDFAPK